MTRADLIEKICERVKSTEKLSVDDLESRKTCNNKNFRCGLYFLFNNKDECIYVGKVGNGKFTSLYRRIAGHGNGSHKIRDKRWYGQVSYGKWCHFNVSVKELNLLERLAIFGMGQPMFNDADSTPQIIDDLVKKYFSSSTLNDDEKSKTHL